MEGSRKRFSKGWFTGLVLGTVAAGGAAVYAVTLPHEFQDGQVASAAQVNANFAALRDAINGTGTCDQGMSRVGPSCVDTNASFATPAADCNRTGQGCTTANLTVGGTLTTPFSWAQALAACTNAGKRLARASEIIAGHNAGVFSIPAFPAVGSTLYVDAAAAREGGQPYAGTHLSLSGGQFELLGTSTAYDEPFPDPNVPNSEVAFRCAR